MNNNKEYLSMYFKDIKKIQAYYLKNRLEDTFNKCLPLLKNLKKSFAIIVHYMVLKVFVKHIFIE